MPAVSVLLAAEGDTREAASTVRDLLGQTTDALEIVVLAGPDSDELAAVAAEDARVRVVSNEAIRIGDRLNQGLAMASGAFVVRAVPGDASAPERLARQIELLTAGELGFVATGWRALDEEGRVERVVSPPAGDAALRAAMEDGDAIGHPTAMMRRDAVLRVGGWRAAFAGREDYDLLLRLLDRHAGACTPEPLVDYRPAMAAPSWRVLEQHALSEIAALAAHDRRQAGRPDHGDQAGLADRALLHRMGVADEEITRTLLARASSAATQAGSRARWRAMREAARLGLGQDGLSSAARAQFLALWLRGMARRVSPPCG